MDILEIIHKVWGGFPLSKEEQAFLDTWLESPINRKRFREEGRIHSAVFAIGMSRRIDCDKGWDRLLRRISRRKRIYRFLSYAAAAVLTVGVGMLLYLSHRQIPAQHDIPTVASRMVSDRNRGVLTLSTGERVTLSGDLPAMTEQNGTTIQNTGQQLVYTSADTEAPLAYNTIAIPRGGEYRLVLSDGSSVWINSASEITYPVSFSGDKREIRLKGEAFFDIRKDDTRPFIVRTEQFDIRVTGTCFNVRNYPREIPSATLVQGHILMEKNGETAGLHPGQQASLVGGKIRIEDVDIEEIIAWRHEAFCFRQRPLESLLEEIARWYDIDIVYQDDEARNCHYTAWFRRSTPLEELVGILEKTRQVKLELKGKTLIVKTNHPNRKPEGTPISPVGKFLEKGKK